MTRDLAHAARAEAILLVVPAQATARGRSPRWRRISPRHAGHRLRQGHRARHAQIHDRGDRGSAPHATPAILSGPSFAADVARGLPTAVTLAAHDEALAAALAQALGSRTFRPYQSTDVRGVEIGGAAKNVLAIAAGIVTGRGLGASARGGADHARLRRAGAVRPRARRAQPRRMIGLSGLGDLILTCSSAAVAQLLARRRTRPRRTRRHATRLAEGAFTAPVLVEMAAAQGVEMPIVRRGRGRSWPDDERRRRRSKCC